MATLVVSVIALVLSLVNFVVTLVLTLRRDDGAIRPVHVFTYRREGWQVENLGNGPALDLVFHRLLGESVTQNVRLPALGTGAAFPLHFARHDNRQVFVATYRDADGRKYSSRSRHDLSTSRTGFEVERVPEAGSLLKWWELPDSDE